MSTTLSHPEGLAEQMILLHGLLRGEIGVAAAARRLGVPAARLALHEGRFHDRAEGILVDTFPLLHEALTSRLWRRLVRGFLAAHPPSHYVPTALAEELPSYLLDLAEGGDPAVTKAMAEIAEIEWYEHVVYRSPEVIPSPETIRRPVLNPTLVILELDYPVAAFVTAWRRRPPDAPPLPLPREASEQAVFVLRSPTTLGSLFVQAEEELLFAFKVAQDGIPLDVAAREAGISEAMAHEVMTRAGDIGLVILPPQG